MNNKKTLKKEILESEYHEKNLEELHIKDEFEINFEVNINN